ncbi:hypothetical protein [Tabrizicola sp.]|uniref:COG3904 family protein n=1 Tax=Tabrizicola sp. TaxID=2005166 RepID=UPI003D29CB99
MAHVTASSGIWWAFKLQAVLAVLLLLTDIDLVWPSARSDNASIPAGPISPGSQIRQYDSRKSEPEYLQLEGTPAVPVPNDIPSRLDFSFILAEDIGNLLLINGQISEGDARRFATFIEDTKEPITHVAFNSPGGVIVDSLEIGRKIRSLGLSTVMLPGMLCLSSCPYMFAGGIDRIVSRTSAVGLHQHYYDAPKFLPVFWAVQSIQFGQGETLEYLIEMGINPSILLYSLKTPPEEIYLMVENELADTLLATIIID